MNCQICGAELPSDALFCGECGSSTSATPASRQRSDARPTDTTLIRPIRPQQTTGIVSVALDGSAVRPADAGTESAGTETAGTESAAETAGAATAGAGHAAAEPGSAGAVPRGSASGTSFVLQFSTGESFDVSGSGLIGRRPLPTAQESFDHLIQITDPGRSVSKTHLEFGQHDNELWVCDRDSGNGTVVRRTDGVVTSCEPGRRYRVARGARVEIGEQFFVVA
ncbi:FHA domain-containing protein [Microterricola viridarii]|uniref:FHA domain-containing protein n=1 Tax=Microterricola viridarii TaxID=412690 RepID=A0A0Y0NA85_9MICO|nr:FHA domain-containing protein [Microterricola viridarii]AMB57981.1 hypothetical protein AWU67_02855 [Microterricola viridarii]